MAARMGKHEAANPAGDEADGQGGEAPEEHRGDILAPDAASLDHQEAEEHEEHEHRAEETPELEVFHCRVVSFDHGPNIYVIICKI